MSTLQQAIDTVDEKLSLFSGAGSMRCRLIPGNAALLAFFRALDSHSASASCSHSSRRRRLVYVEKRGHLLAEVVMYKEIPPTN